MEGDVTIGTKDIGGGVLPAACPPFVTGVLGHFWKRSYDIVQPSHIDPPEIQLVRLRIVKHKLGTL